MVPSVELGAIPRPATMSTTQQPTTLRVATTAQAVQLVDKISQETSTVVGLLPTYDDQVTVARHLAGNQQVLRRIAQWIEDTAPPIVVELTPAWPTVNGTTVLGYAVVSIRPPARDQVHQLRQFKHAVWSHLGNELDQAIPGDTRIGQDFQGLMSHGTSDVERDRVILWWAGRLTNGELVRMATGHHYMEEPPDSAWHHAKLMLDLLRRETEGD